jgi:predicted metal-dependent phosphoesterase TrpH
MTIHADLHLHSTASDGADAPARVVDRAKARGLAVMALTDHDSVGGVREAQARGREVGVHVVSGIEFSTRHGRKEVHVLAFGLDPANTELLEFCRWRGQMRRERAEAIAKALESEGIRIDMARVEALADGGTIGRPHVAKVLIEMGVVATWDEAFDRYLGDGKPANVPSVSVSVEEAAGIARRAGGAAFIAHPGLDRLWDFVGEFHALGVPGIECFHSSHSMQDENRALSLAHQHGMIVSGGSDCHGACGDRPEIMGLHGLDESRWRSMERRLAALGVRV